MKVIAKSGISTYTMFEVNYGISSTSFTLGRRASAKDFPLREIPFPIDGFLAYSFRNRITTSGGFSLGTR